MQADPRLGIVALIGFVCTLSDAGRSEFENRNERAYDRMVEDYYGGDGPQTERERAEARGRDA